MSPTIEAPTRKQLHYLRTLANRTGTTFARPATRGQASREIRKLLALKSDSYADARREGREISWDMSHERGYATGVHAEEVAGYGSSARWCAGTWSNVA